MMFKFSRSGRRSSKRHLQIVYAEPAGDIVSRLGLKLAFLCLLLPGIGALHRHLSWGAGRSSGSGWVRHAPEAEAHALALSLGFGGLFVLSLLFRIVPRGRVDPLPRPRWAKKGMWCVALACCVTAFAPATPGAWVEGTLGVLWVGAAVGLGGSLGACFVSKARVGLWWDGWLLAGLVVLGMVWVTVALANLALALQLTEDRTVLRRVPLTALWAGLCPIAAVLSARMLPSLSNLRSPDRDRIKSTAPLVVAASVVLAGGLLLDRPVGVLLGASVLGLLYERLFLAMSLLRLEVGHAASKASAAASPARVLRWSARTAWLAFALGHVTLTLASVQALAAGLVAWVPARTLTVAGTHLIGLGFITGLALAVGQRVVPAWLNEDVRWPLLRPAVAVLWAAALLQRIGVELLPMHGRVLLSSALWCLLLSGVVFVAQVGRSIRPRGTSIGGGCPAAPMKAPASSRSGPSSGAATG